MPQNGIKKNLELSEIVPSDLEEVARFITRMSRCDTPLASAVARLSWILLENPARVQGDPVGWLCVEADPATPSLLLRSVSRLRRLPHRLRKFNLAHRGRGSLSAIRLPLYVRRLGKSAMAKQAKAPESGSGRLVGISPKLFALSN